MVEGEVTAMEGFGKTKVQGSSPFVISVFPSPCMDSRPTRGSRGGKSTRARQHNELQQIIVDQNKQQGRRFRWLKPWAEEQVSCLVQVAIDS